MKVKMKGDIKTEADRLWKDNFKVALWTIFTLMVFAGAIGILVVTDGLQ